MLGLYLLWPYHNQIYRRVFKLVPPTPHLKPEKIVPKKQDDSPFVYTPFVVNRDRVKDASKAGKFSQPKVLHAVNAE